MTSAAQSKRHKQAASSQQQHQQTGDHSSGSSETTQPETACESGNSAGGTSEQQSAGKQQTSGAAARQTESNNSSNNYGVDVDDLTDDTDSEDDEDEELEDDLGDKSGSNHIDIQEQLAAAGPAGVAAAAAIATARKRKRPHSFETNPSVRKRQQTRLIRKLRASIDEYTMRVGQQAVVLITMPGKAVHNFKVFGAQPLESVIRNCKHEIMGELEQALLEQAPQQFKEDTNKHELPPLVIDGIPTPVEKMTQAQLRAFIPLMLKYSTGRGKPGWGKDTTRPPWWPETLPWANVRSDARDEGEKQRISWTTTLRQIVTNCYKFHGRDDLLPTFDESQQTADSDAEQSGTVKPEEVLGRRSVTATRSKRNESHLSGGLYATNNSNNSQQVLANGGGGGLTAATAGNTSYVMHTIANGDGTVSLIQLDPSNAQILTLPDGTQVRAVRLQTLGSSANEAQLCQQQQLVEAAELAPDGAHSALSVSEAQLSADGQIIVMGEDGTQNCYPMSSLVSIPASMYQQFAQSGQQLSLINADGSISQTGALTIHALQEEEPQLGVGEQQQQQVSGADDEQQVHNNDINTDDPVLVKAEQEAQQQQQQQQQTTENH